MLDGNETGCGQVLDFQLDYWCAWRSQAINPPSPWPGGELLSNDHGKQAVVDFLPMMQRRRLSPMARAACAVVWPCRQRFAEMPTVFYSAHGETHIYLDMLVAMAAGEETSPSRFSLAVHNAIAGQCSFLSECVSPYVVLADSGESVFGALLEAAGWLLTEERVLVVAYEQPLPSLYRAYLDNADITWALALVLSRAKKVGLRLKLTRQSAANIVLGLDRGDVLLEAAASGLRYGSCRLQRSIWQWRLDDN
jgi:Beta-ketoacyl synthase, N-terminal domain